MKDQQTPVPPPPQPPEAPPVPPPPPAATAETTAGETAPPPSDAALTPPEATTDQSSLDDHDAHDDHALAAAEGEGMIAPAEALPTAAERTPLPVLTHDRIVAAIRRQLVDVDGVPEAEFARDFPIPVEARRALVLAVGLELFGMPPNIPENDPELDRFVNVGALIDRLMEEAIEEHTGSDR